LFGLAFAAGLGFGTVSHGRTEAVSECFSPGFSESSGARVLGYEGRMVSDPRKTASGMTGYDLELTTALASDGARTTASGHLSVYCRPAPSARKPGLAAVAAPVPVRSQLVRVALDRGTLAPRTGAGAWSDALAPRTAFVDAADITPLDPPLRPGALRASARRSLLAAVSRAGGQAGPLLEALVVGVRDDLDSNLADDFRQAGCAHILALSGQHVGILAGFVSLLLGFVLGPFRARTVACLLAGAYLYLVGASPSVARAVLMFWVSSAASAADRPQKPLATLSVVFVVAVAVWPQSAQALSFKLSYLAVAGIAIFGPAWEFGLRRWLPPPLSAAMATGLAALAATAPLSVMTFGTLNPFSPATSALAGLLVSALMYAGLAGAVLVALLPAAAPLVAFTCYLPYRALATLMRAAARLPAIAIAGATLQGATQGNPMLERTIVALVVAIPAAFVYAWPHVAYLAESRRRSTAGQLRFPLGTLLPPGRPGPGHAQEIRPEFPHLRPGQTPHRRPLRHPARRAGLGNWTGHRLHDP
jgi:competence protein ComEC